MHNRCSLSITIQCYNLIYLDFTHIFILFSKTIFIAAYTLLVGILLSASAQLVFCGLVSCHGGGGAEEAAEECSARERKHDKQAQLPDLIQYSPPRKG